MPGSLKVDLILVGPPAVIDEIVRLGGHPAAGLSKTFVLEPGTYSRAAPGALHIAFDSQHSNPQFVEPLTRHYHDLEVWSFSINQEESGFTASITRGGRNHPLMNGNFFDRVVIKHNWRALKAFVKTLDFQSSNPDRDNNPSWSVTSQYPVIECYVRDGASASGLSRSMLALLSGFDSATEDLGERGCKFSEVEAGGRGVIEILSEISPWNTNVSLEILLHGKDAALDVLFRRPPALVQSTFNRFALWGNLGMVKALLERRPDLAFERDLEGATAIEYICTVAGQVRHHDNLVDLAADEELLPLLFRNGARHDSVDARGMTPLELLVCELPSEESMLGDTYEQEVIPLIAAALLRHSGARDVQSRDEMKALEMISTVARNLEMDDELSLFRAVASSARLRRKTRKPGGTRSPARSRVIDL